MRTIAERFWSKVDKRRPRSCWMWIGTVDKDGYGLLVISGKPMKAHRISMMMVYGEIQPGLNVCHRCDVPGCVNPAHLFVGTAGDNSRDASRKGRLVRSQESKDRLRTQAVQRKARGEANANARLKAIHIPFIRLLNARGISYHQISKGIGCSKATVAHICARLSWRHIVAVE